MAEWIKKAAQSVKDKREKARLENEKNVREAQAVKLQSPRLWNELKEAVIKAVDEFNAEFANEPNYNKIVQVSFPEDDRVGISVVYGRVGQAFPSIVIHFQREKEVIEGKFQNMNECTASRPPGMIYFQVNPNGNVNFSDGKDQLTLNITVQNFLMPIFNCVDL